MVNTILGVKIDDINMSEALEIVRGWMKSDKKHYIVTPNPEFIMSAQRDLEFREILNKADLKLPDGVGLKLAGVKNIIPGVDFMEKLCLEASVKGWKVGFFGGRDSVAQKSAEILKQKYPGLNVVFVDESSPAPYMVQDRNDREVDILFVGLGHGKQERWIVRNMDKVNSKVFMGVGGSFDYISGKIPRAPVFIRELGFEWLFRLVIQPWRIKRQVALLKFAWCLLFVQKT